jgi:DNA-binding FadR family transcriptional regulator
LVDEERPLLNSSLALNRLRRILAEREMPGEWRLPAERELAVSVGVGRRAVRRAMEVLEAEGLVWRRQGKGTFAGHGPSWFPYQIDDLASRTNPIEVMEARIELEPALARLAAMRASPGRIASLERLVQKTAQADDDDSWELWDSALHRSIAEAGSNGLMLVLFDFIHRVRQDTIWRRVRAMARTQASRIASVDEHAAIVRAIANRDAAGAERAMRRHLTAISTNLRSLMLGASPDSAEEGGSRDGIVL